MVIDAVEILHQWELNNHDLHYGNLSPEALSHILDHAQTRGFTAGMQYLFEEFLGHKGNEQHLKAM
jgi:hypothetical protein